MDRAHPTPAQPLGIESLPCGVCRLRMDGELTVLSANQFFYRLFGYERSDSALPHPASLHTLTYPSDWPLLHSGILEDVHAGKALLQRELRVIHRSGLVLWVLLCCTPFPGPDGYLDCILIDITARIHAMERLRASEEERQLLLTHTGRFAFRFYLSSRTAVLPPDTARELGMSERMELFPDQVTLGGWCGDECREDFARFFQSMVDGASGGSVRLRFRSGKGEFTWYSFAYSMVYSADGRGLHAVVSFEDVSQQREKELAYEKWSQYNQAQMESAVVYYECNLTRNVLEKLDGYTAFCYPQDAMHSYDEMLAYVVDTMVWVEDRELYNTHFLRETLLSHYRAGGREHSLDCRRLDSEGQPFWVRVTVQILPDPFSDDVKAFILVRDINTEKLREEELRCRSQTDPLTGVLNRGAFVEQLSALFAASPPGTAHGLVMLDVDRFKDLNDTMGHQFGDKVLVDIAEILRNALRSDDLIGRLGGDEFVLCLKNMPSRRALEDKMANICGALTLTFTEGGNTSGSLGGVLYPEEGTDFMELYRKADLALYKAKRQGRARYMLFDSETMG